MTRLKTSRVFSRAVPLAGALSLAVGLLIVSNPDYYGFDSPLDYLVMAAEAAALVATLAALTGLHVRLSAAYGRLGKAGFSVALIGTISAGAGHLGAVPFFDFASAGGVMYVLVALKEGFFLVGGVAYALGLSLMSAGYVLIGVAMLRSGASARWRGLALMAGIAGLWSANALGWILFGFSWLLLGYALFYHLSTTYRPGNDGTSRDAGDAAKEKPPQTRGFRELPEKDSDLH